MKIKNHKNFSLRSGFSLLEILLGVGLFSLLVSAVIGSFSFAIESKFVSGSMMRASDIALEGVEAVRNIRGENFSRLIGGTYGISTTTNRWNLTGSPDVVDNFYSRSINIDELGLYRRKISATTTWAISDVRQGRVALVTYLTNWARSVTNWATASLEAVFDLTAANSGNAAANAISIAFRDPYIFEGRAGSAGSEFYIYDASTTTSPVLSGQLGLSGNPSDIAVLGNYAFIASTDNTADLQVIDVTAPSAPSLATSTALTVGNSGNDTANGLVVAIGGSYLYYGRANSAGRELIIFDISSPASPLIVGQLDLSGDPNDIVVSGNYIFIAGTDNTTELQVVNVTTPSSPSLVGTFNLDSGNNGADALSASVSGSTLYMGRIATVGAPEFYVLDVTTPATPTLTSTLEIGSDLISMDLATSTNPSPMLMAATSDATGDFKAIDATISTAAEIFGFLDISNSPAEIVYSSGRDRVFIASSANTEELQIIKPN